MPWPEFSEFTFGYALTKEIECLNRAPATIAPIFPTQVQEGKTGGYDVEIPMHSAPIFLQIKRSFVLTRNNAKEAYLLGTPYFRMHFHKKNGYRQHTLLRDWALRHPSTFYATSQFEALRELNIHYAGNTVLSVGTALFAPSNISLPNVIEDHYLAFNRNSAVAYMCSEQPTKMERNILEPRKVIEETAKRFSSEKQLSVELERVDRELQEMAGSLGVRSAMSWAVDLPIRQRIPAFARFTLDLQTAYVPVDIPDDDTEIQEGKSGL